MLSNYTEIHSSIYPTNAEIHKMMSGADDVNAPTLNHKNPLQPPILQTNPCSGCTYLIQYGPRIDRNPDYFQRNVAHDGADNPERLSCLCTV